MTREQRLTMADAATTRAATLASEAEDAARHPDHQRKVQPLATAGALWADVARAHAAIAAAMTAEEK